MSDFLARIAERSRGTSEVVKPRPRSMFEPEASDADLRISTAPDAAGADEGLADLVLRPETRRSSAEFESESEEADDGRNRDGNREQERPEPNLNRPLTRASQKVQADTVDSLKPRTNVRQAAVQVAISSPPPQTHLDDLGETGTGRPAADNRSAPAFRIVDSTDSEVRQRNEPDEPRSSLAADGRALLDNRDGVIGTRPSDEPPARTARDDLRIAARPAQPRFQPASATLQSANDEAVINVTIGRLEVRAVAAQPPTRREPSGPSPVMSLDEYMKRERAGRR